MANENGQRNLKIWKDYLKTHNPEALADILADDCTFYSPVVFTPQQGKDMTIKYLMAAGPSLSGEESGEKSPDGERKFKYTREIVDGDNIMLEFETEIDGKYVNGIDIIHFTADGLIDEFKVMIRPLQAVNKVWEKMGAALEQAS